MKFEFKEQISHPTDQVYGLLKDGLTKLVPLVPNVTSVRELEREDLGDWRTRIVNEWEGDPGTAPRPIRKFIRPEFLGWRDYAEWDDSQQLVNWRFESAVFRGLYSCGGTNYVEPDGSGGTTVRLTGELVLYPDKVPGVPKMLARSVAPGIEKWLMNLVSPNLAELPKAVQVFLDQS